MKEMKFYSVKLRKSVMVPESKVKYVKSKNGRNMAVADYQGQKLYRFIK